MGCEFKVSHLVGQLVALRVEEELNPPYVVLRGIGVGYFLAQRHCDVKHFVRRDCIRTLNEWHMMFVYQIGAFIQFS